MNKSIHFFEQPVYDLLINWLEKDNIIEMSRKDGGERYIKNFDERHQLLTMLYTVIKAVE